MSDIVNEHDPSLDEELLDLAGGGDSEEESEPDDFANLEAEFGGRSPSQEPKPSVERVEDSQGTRRGVAQKVKSRGRRKRRQESEDEDAGSPPPAESPRSGGMDEYDGEADGPVEDDEAPLFPIDGKFRDESDRAHVMAMTEIDREAELAERAEQVIRHRQDMTLRRATMQSRAAASRNKRKAAEDLEDGNKRSMRPKTAKQNALDSYRRAREEKNTQRSQIETDRGRRDGRDERSPSASDRDADGESEVEYAEPAYESRRDEPPAELKDFERCRVGRSNFASVCFYPSFEESIKGCFARISIGPNRENGQNMYRMTQIRGFTDGKPYQLENAHGKQFTTDQYAIVAHGAAEKAWPFSACSDGKFNEAEFTRFRETLQKDNINMPSRRFLTGKLDAIHSLLNQKFTEDSLQIKFAKQRAMELKFDPVHIVKQKRKDIAKRRAEAKQIGDEEEIARCDSELEALDNSAASTNGAAKVKPAIAKAAPHDRLAQLNHTNRHKEQERVRQALIAERKKEIRAREAMKEKQAQAAKLKAQSEAKSGRREAALQKSAIKDLFGEGSDTSRAGTPASGIDTPKKSRAQTPLTQPSNGAKLPVGALKKKNLDDDVIGGLDLDIEVEI
ncbi:hypothetical protein DOTSEDRAFT_70340 [Dothistroma septosporum NZE10]|uniref:Plus3 domain-containing protein n=1 Tax=Dothistroma septosporum (strain NZE10 / CBS 128990) TaxID=675120 RepID=N1PSF3_DOTSN|nr:hypothetical protein DOTSEDRAFT_70340 [Dothistroma septosporum NZE10]